MSMIDALIGEMEQEANATRRMLEVVPADKLDWKPHPKSMSLGQLALHVATVPGQVSGLMKESRIEPPEGNEFPSPDSAAELVGALDESLAAAKETLLTFDDASLMETFTVASGDHEIMSMPKIGVARAIMLNHWYHHRGQLSVYLRMQDVSLPSVYGPTADENPFAVVNA